MGVAERHAREKEALRSKIQAAASELFLELGYQNVSIRKIAEKIEYAPSTIYLHFKDKQELLESICIDTFAKLNESMTELDQRDLAPLERLEQGMRCYINFGLQHPHHYLATFGVPARDEQGKTIESEAVGNIGLQSFSHLQAIIARCMDSGDIRKGDAMVTAQSVWMMIHGVTDLLITHTEYSGFPWAPKDQLVDLSVANLIRGLQ